MPASHLHFLAFDFYLLPGEVLESSMTDLFKCFLFHALDQGPEQPVGLAHLDHGKGEVAFVHGGGRSLGSWGCVHSDSGRFMLQSPHTRDTDFSHSCPRR